MKTAPIRTIAVVPREQPPQPDTPKRYRTLLADPPWSHHQRGGYGASRHYPLMELDQIKAMPIADLADDNAHLYLWVTAASLRDGYDVLDAWGFQPRGIITWVKPRMGLGAWIRTASEHIIFATRGRAPVQFKGQPSWFWAPYNGHSTKPLEQYGIIERLSPGPYLELFARRRQVGWDVWGNEVDSQVSIPGYPVPSDPPSARVDPQRHERRRAA